MSAMITKAVKIFVEPDEEIAFTIEKILGIETTRVILVVPHTAALISSAVSLKILSRQIAKSRKSIILVCDNAVARNLGEKADLAVRGKISEVDKDAWAEAKELKDKVLDVKTKIKEELLGARHEPEVEAEPKKQEVISDKPVTARLEEDKTTDENDTETGLATDDLATGAETGIMSSKPRLNGKVVDINNIKLFAGGDILENDELLDLERSRLTADEESELDEANAKEDMHFNTNPNNLVGRDLTKLSGQDRIKAGQSPKKKFVMPVFVTKALDRLTEGSTIRNLIIGFLILFVIFMAVSFFFFSSVAINITLAQTTSPVKQTITASTEETEIKPALLTMPASLVTKTSTRSGDGTATQESTKGEAASGKVTVYNLTTAPITIGTDKEFSTASGTTYKYKAVTSVTVPAKNDSTNAPGTADVTIKAVAIGAEYNTTDSKQFSIQGYNFTDINARNFSEIGGGGSTPAIVISEQDLKDLEAIVEAELKTELLSSLRNLISSDDILLSGTEKFTKVSFTTDKKQGEEAADNKFTGELKMTITALIIKKPDLKNLVGEIVRIETGSNELAEIEVRDPLLQDIAVVSDTKATFLMQTQASISAGFDIDELKEGVKGKGIDEAKSFINEQQGVEDVRVRYTPPYIPAFMQKIPDDTSKFTITVVKSSD